MSTTPSSLIMTFDFGTQSVRVCVFNQKGDCLALEKKKYEPAYHSPKPGYAEMDPNYYFECLCDCTKKVANEHADLIEDVAGVVVSCFRDTAVCLDSDMKVIRPSVLWLDQRMAKCEDKFPLLKRALYKIVGMSKVIELNRRRTVMNWIKENEPENYKKIDKYVALSTYFNYILTGSLSDSASSNTGHYPIDYKKKVWVKNPKKGLTAPAFGVESHQLSEIKEQGTAIGKITPEAAKATGLPVGLTIFTGGSDKSCETLGAGVYNDKFAAVSLGTACTIETTTSKYIEPLPFMPAYPNVLPGLYNMDIQIYRGYWMINWFLKEFGAWNINDLIVDEVDPAEFNKKLAEVPVGSDGVMLQPFWGSQLDRPQVKGAIVGFSENTTKMHVYRSIIEGIAYELRYSKDNIEKRIHKKFEEIRISGGGAISDEICQITADVLNCPVVRVQTIETSSLGAAISGFLTIGTFSSPKEAVDSMVHPATKFQPNQDNVAVYDALYKNAYAKLYPSLKDVYRYLYDFTAR